MSTTITTATPSMSQDGLFDFYATMDSKGRRTFSACVGGFAMDAMDFMIYPLVIGTLIALCHIDAKTAGGIATVTLWSSAIGEWSAGHHTHGKRRVRTIKLCSLLS